MARNHQKTLSVVTLPLRACVHGGIFKEEEYYAI